GEQLDQALLHGGNQFPHTQAQPPQIKHQVADQLAGAVVGHLPAPLHLDDRNIPRRQQVLGLAGLPLGEHRRVLQQPDLVSRPGIALGGQRAHGVQRGLVFHQPQMTHDQLGHHSTMCTWPVALRSRCSCCSCSSPVAVITSRRDWNRPFLLSCTTSLLVSSAGSCRRTTTSTRSTTPSPAEQMILIGYWQGNSIFGISGVLSLMPGSSVEQTVEEQADTVPQTAEQTGFFYFGQGNQRRGVHHFLTQLDFHLAQYVAQ